MLGDLIFFLGVGAWAVTIWRARRPHLRTPTSMIALVVLASTLTVLGALLENSL